MAERGEMDGTTTESAELACLVGIRSGRAQLYNALTETAEANAPESCRDPDGSLSRAYLGLIRNDGAALVAEFFFLIDELGLTDPARFRAFVERHNTAMEAYLDDPGSMRSLGLTPQRVKAARFSPEQIGFIELVSPSDALYLDQSSIGRLLAEAIAPESTRKIVIALAEGGLLQRHTLRHVLISSNGVLERLYGQYLKTVIGALKEVR